MLRGKFGHPGVADLVAGEAQLLESPQRPTGDGAREGAHANVADLVIARRDLELAQRPLDIARENPASRYRRSDWRRGSGF